MSDPTNLNAMEASLSRAEWIAASALAISLIQGAYVAGVEVQRLNDHDRRISGVEAGQSASAGKIETLLITTTRIDANLTALAEKEHDHSGGAK